MTWMVDEEHLIELLDRWKRRRDGQSDDAAWMAIAQCVDELEIVVNAWRRLAAK